MPQQLTGKDLTPESVVTLHSTHGGQIRPRRVLKWLLCRIMHEIKTASQEKQAWESPPQKDTVISSLRPCGPWQLRNVSEVSLEKELLNCFRQSRTSERTANHNTAIC